MLDETLTVFTSRGHPPAAQLCVFRSGRLAYEGASGRDHVGRPIGVETIFDVASITKLWTTTALALLQRDGKLDLDAPLAKWVPEAKAASATLRQLLIHQAGLPAWKPLFARVMSDPLAQSIYAPERRSAEAFARARGLVLAEVMRTPRSGEGRQTYSDLGFVLLGEVVQRALGSLESAVLDGVVAHCEGTAGYGRLPAAPWLAKHQVVATGKTRPRPPAPGQEGSFAEGTQAHRADPGDVDDDNAFALGGVAGHAGGFANARAIASLGALWCEAFHGRGPLELGSLGREFTSAQPGTDPPRGLGFDRLIQKGSSAGPRFGQGALGGAGHLGYTGCSLWIDFERELAVALLTNRTFPGREHVEGIRSLRRAVHEAVVDRFGDKGRTIE